MNDADAAREKLGEATYRGGAHERGVAYALSGIGFALLELADAIRSQGNKDQTWKDA